MILAAECEDFGEVVKRDSGHPGGAYSESLLIKG
jgi:hypothetical protein